MGNLINPSRFAFGKPRLGSQEKVRQRHSFHGGEGYGGVTEINWALFEDTTFSLTPWPNLLRVTRKLGSHFLFLEVY